MESLIQNEMLFQLAVDRPQAAAFASVLSPFLKEIIENLGSVRARNRHGWNQKARIHANGVSGFRAARSRREANHHRGTHPVEGTGWCRERLNTRIPRTMRPLNNRAWTLNNRATWYVYEA